MNPSHVSPLLVLALLAGCASNLGLEDTSYPTGSSTVAGSADHRVLYAADPWDGTLNAMELGNPAVAQLDLGGEPTRVARVGDDLWVTQRATRSIAIVEARGVDLTLTRELEAGAEPHGIVASEDGSRVYVAMSQEDQVWEYDGSTQEVLRQWDVPDDPRWLALHPTGDVLVVVHGYKAAITRIDLEEGQVVGTLEHPTRTRPTVEGEIEMTPRNTGDPTFSPLGDALVVPTLYVDNLTPVDDPNIDDGTVTPPPGGGGYASNGSNGQILSVDRMNPSLNAFPFDEKTGEPQDDEIVMAMFVGGQVGSDSIRGYISSAAFTPDGTEVVATLESGDAVAIVSLLPFADQGDALHAEGVDVSEPHFGKNGNKDPFIDPSQAGFHERPQEMILTERGPTGTAMTNNGRMMVYEAGSRSFANTRMIDAQRRIDDAVDTRDEGFGPDPKRNHIAGQRTVLGTSRLTDEVEKGRELFYSATLPTMVAPGAGVSCSTCHLEGRNDGLTWTFTNGVRQTPSLAGEVSRTEPVTWTLDVESVAREAQITSAGRMGGHGLSDSDAAAIGAYIDWTRRVDVADVDADLADLGAQIFSREDVGCATCHSGDALTDNKFHPLYGLDAVNTPTLEGIAATAPYLHDGSAATLRDVLDTAQTGAMGDTSMLSEHEMDALEAYLKSL